MSRLLSGISRIVRGIASRVLAIDDTVFPKSQVSMLQEIFSRHNFDLDFDDFSELLLALKHKHLVDSIIVTKRDGTVVASSEQNGLKTAITGTALFNYVNSELAKTETILIKSNGDWFMVFPFREKVFVVKASASLSVTELRALAKELDCFLSANETKVQDKAFLKN